MLFVDQYNVKCFYSGNSCHILAFRSECLRGYENVWANKLTEGVWYLVVLLKNMSKKILAVKKRNFESVA
jgi:hypothetical protein